MGIAGHPVCIRRTFNGHLSGIIYERHSTVVTNLSRFRVGAWQLKVNDQKFKSIVRVDGVCTPPRECKVRVHLAVGKKTSGTSRRILEDPGGLRSGGSGRVSFAVGRNGVHRFGSSTVGRSIGVRVGAVGQ